MIGQKHKYIQASAYAQVTYLPIFCFPLHPMAMTITLEACSMIFWLDKHLDLLVIFRFAMSNFRGFVLIFLFVQFPSKDVVNGQQAYCWDPCQFNCPQIGPRLCPPENILTYYDCCPSDGCCQYIKWPNLLFLLFIIFLLLAGCVCCAFFLLTDARQRMFHRQQQQKEEEKGRQRQANNSATNGGEGLTGFRHKRHSSTIV